ncbi:hypothetical protein [Massilia sp. TN1-12]|uniref:hypothetical protein n=1 Tax=Massilia paldalensis TaxID=3377675 RepID=UPI00384C6BFB
MSVEFTDILQLPKHRGKTVQQVFDMDPSYLLWLRDKKKDEGRPDYFDPEVLRALNGAIKRDKWLAKMREQWNETRDGRVLPPGVVANPGATTPTTTPAPWDEERRPSLSEITEAQERQRVYAESWGSF